MIKGDDDDEEAEDFVMAFKPNKAQTKFIKRLYYRNIILKARQLGFTTLIAIMWLDHALFNGNQNCGIIAQGLKEAESIFKHKVKFAYENLPPEILKRYPLKTDSKTELHFSHNNSSIKVGVSMRSGTFHRLHISEFGKICAKFPEKAAEVMTGSIPTVPKTGILVIESTAEGRGGDFFRLTQKAIKLFASRKRLSNKDYRLHFYAWWDEENYRLDSRTVDMTTEDHEYFDLIEAQVKEDMGISLHLDADQRAWYVATRNADFEGNEDRMWQEYPSFPDEAFQVSTEGNYYAKDILKIRKRDGITEVLHIDAPVYTFWDIGRSDGTAIWFLQHINGQDRWIRYYEAHYETLAHYVGELKSYGYIYGGHFLPHDAGHERLSDTNKSTKEMLEDLMPGEDFEVLPRISELMAGIQQTRAAMKNYYFDENLCKLGIERLEGYKKKFSKADMRYIDQPNKANGCSEAADAIRQHAQAKESGLLNFNSHKRKAYKPAASADWRVA